MYRTGKVPVYDTGGLAARAADPSLLAVLRGTIRQGLYPAVRATRLSPTEALRAS